MKADKKENALLKGKVSSQDLIFSVLSEKIKKGILSAGEELKQVELAKSFGVSRMPVREALNRLVAEGYAEKLSNRHIIVRGKKGSPGCTFEGVLTFPRCFNGDDGIHHEACIFMMDGAVFVLKKAAFKKQAA